MTRPEILYSDEHIAVAVKPYGILSEDADGEEGMPSLLKDMLGGEIFAVHRLDRTTRGVMVYARTRASAARLSALISDGRVEKTYLAVVEGDTEPSGELTDLLYYDRARGKSYVVRRERRGVKEARLSYERLSAAEYNGARVSLLRVRLLTGRTHQIRVQFASRKHPLVGDRRYGSRIEADDIALCAAQLSFPHPMSGEPMSFDCRPEGDVFGVIPRRDKVPTWESPG